MNEPIQTLIADHADQVRRLPYIDQAIDIASLLPMGSVARHTLMREAGKLWSAAHQAKHASMTKMDMLHRHEEAEAVAARMKNLDQPTNDEVYTILRRRGAYEVMIMTAEYLQKELAPHHYRNAQFNAAADQLRKLAHDLLV